MKKMEAESDMGTEQKRKNETETSAGRTEIRLRKLRPGDAEGMLEWINDAEIQKGFRFADGGKTLEEVAAFIRSAGAVPVHGKSVHFAIADMQDEYLGTISLKNFNLTARNAEYAIALRKKAQGKGIAAEATDKLLELAFTEFQLEKVYLNVLSDNHRAIRLYEQYGFFCEGEFRRHLYLRGEMKGLRWYSLTREEYVSLKKGKEAESRKKEEPQEQIVPNRLDRGFYLHQKEFEKKALDVLRSGWYVLGNEVSAFEEEFASYLGAKYCVGLASGLDALWIAFRVLGIGSGDEVIVQGNTYIGVSI